MKINVTKNKVSIKEEQILNENEYNIHKIQFDFSSEYTDDLVKVALFSIDNHTYKKIISNNECDIPPEVLTQRGYSILGVYAYKTEQDTLVLRYSPSPTKISVYDGSYKADAENSEPITPSEIEQYQQILQNSLQQFQNQYNALVEETEGDIQAIEDELQRKVDEGYFDGEDGFSPIATVTQLQNGARIEIEDKNGRTSVDVLNGQDGYSPVRGVDYWTEEDKQEVEEEATQQIDGKIEEYNTNAQNKLNQYNSNATQKTTDYNTNAEQKMSAYNTNATEKTSTYNTNATEKFNNYNSNAEQKETNYNTNASQKVESFNTNASSKLSEYNSNAETKKSAYDENATQKTNSFNTNATNKLTEYNTNHTEKMSAYNSNNTEKLNAFNENATQKTEDFDEHTEEIQDNIEKLQTENARLKATLPTTTGEGQNITLNKTAELEFKKPPLPMGNSEQVQYSGKNLFNYNVSKTGIIYNINNDIFTFYRNTGSDFLIPFNELKLKTNTNYVLYMNIIENTMTSNFVLVTSASVFLQGSFSIEIGQTGIKTAEVSTASSIDNLLYDLWFYCNGSGSLKANVMLVEGTTQGEYEPYTGGTASPNPDYPQEITNVTGDVEVKVQNIENFLDWNKFIDFSNWETALSSGYMAFKIDGLKVNTKYTLCRVNDDGYNILPAKYAGFNPARNNTNRFIDYAVQSSNLKSVTATTNVNGTLYIIFYMSNATQLAQYIELINNCWVIEGESFVEKEQQTFTFPLGNEKLMLGDYLADDGIHHVRGQVVLDGTQSINIENWRATETSVGWVYPRSVTQNKIATNSSIMSNKLIACSYADLFNNIKDVGISIVDNSNAYGIVIKTSDTTLNNTNSINTYLSNNPILAEYELEQEVIVPYTSAQQTVYNQIKQAISYEEQTNISSNQNALFSVEAYLNSKVILAEKYVKPSTGIPKTDLASSVQTSLNKADTALQSEQYTGTITGITMNGTLKGTSGVIDLGTVITSHQDISGKQDITDNSLTTINKTIPTAINEVDSIAKGANQALSYSNYSAMITAFNSLANNVYNVGQNVMIVTLEVPDLWISGIESTSQTYTYTTDEAITTALSANGYIQVGYYKLSALETQKVNLLDYEQNTNKVTSLSANSTDTQYPSAKCVHDSQEEQNTEIEKLQTENARLKATLPTTTGEGEDVTLDKTAEMEFVKPPLPRGNSEQESTTGKNLWINEIENGETVNGITVTKNKDGSLTFNGTATGLTQFYFVKNNSTGKYLEANQTYTLSGVKNSNTALSSACIIGGIGNSTTNDVSTITPISTREITKDNSFIRFSQGTVLSNYTIKPFIEIGTTQGEYEPYTGGTASPNPDYPQEITNVTGDVEVTISNENNAQSQTYTINLGSMELCKIGDYQDYLYKDNGKWYKYGAIGKLTITSVSSVGTASTGIKYALVRSVTIASASSFIYCSNYVNSTDSTKNNSIRFSGTNLYVYDNRFTNYTTALNLLNGLEYYCVLATPTSTEITDVTLISQLEEISKTLSYQGQTNISSNTIALFNVEAYQSTKLVLEERNAKYESLEARVALLE